MHLLLLVLFLSLSGPGNKKFGLPCSSFGSWNPMVTPGTLEVSLDSIVGACMDEQQRVIVSGLDASWESLKNTADLGLWQVKLASMLCR